MRAKRIRGKTASATGQQKSTTPVLRRAQLPNTEAAHANQYATEISEALLISGLRQHELTEVAENLNRQLQAEIVVRTETEKALRESEEEILRLNADLEHRVIERTAQLQAAYVELHDKNIELQNAAEVRDLFLANMSHELRTPLNGIIGFAEFLVDGKPGMINPKQKEYLQDILNSGRHLLQLISDILDLTKVGSGKMGLYPERFSIRKAIEEACALSQPVALQKAIQINVNVAPKLGEVTIDQQKFKQILYNLLSNAIKFNRNGGQVEVLAEPGDTNRFKLVVHDTGIGIKSEDLTRLFNQFQQLESHISRHYEGTGLGLALTRKLVELHGGNISVESEFGKGSDFTVVLPLVLAETLIHRDG
jgi:signal transduction histidine kinase